MGKKFKKMQKSDDVAREVKSESNSLMGLSSKSKKIKKTKFETKPEVLEVVPKSKTKSAEGIVVAKKKNKKHKNPSTGTVPFGGQPEIKAEHPTSDGPKKFKTHKKQNKNSTNATNADQSQLAIEGKEVKIEGSDQTDALKESKKHKKKGKRHANTSNGGELQQTATPIEVDAKVDGPVSKKSKKHKRKATEFQPPETIDQEVPHKKHKKKKHGKNPVKLEATTEESKKSKKPKSHVKTLEADRDVVTSESESDDEEDGHNEMDHANQLVLKQHSSKAQNGDGPSTDEGHTEPKANGKETKEEKKVKRFPGPEHSIFIGNLPNTVKKSTMKSLFNQYGKILTVRFRSNDGITLFKKKDRKEAKALNCYIRFETKPEAQAACAMNGQLVEGNRIRVTMHMQKQMGHISSTVFVGNINRKTTDNELYDFFSRVGDIEYVRQISDKGIGYVCFKKGVSIAKAMKMNQQLLNGRPLRIMKVDPTKQGHRKNKKGNLVEKRRGGKPPTDEKRNRKQDGPMPKAPVKEYHGSVAHHNKKGKKHKTKMGGGDKKKKLLAQKLNAAAGTSRNK